MKKYKTGKTEVVLPMKFSDFEVDEKFIYNDTKYIVNSKEVGTVPTPGGDIEVGMLNITNIRLSRAEIFYFLKENM